MNQLSASSTTQPPLLSQFDPGNDTFFMVPSQFLLLSKSLTPTALRVYLALLSFRNTKSGRICPSYITIAERAGIHTTRVATALRQLEDSGFIARSSRGPGRGNDYYIRSLHLATSNHDVAQADIVTDLELNALPGDCDATAPSHGKPHPESIHQPVLFRQRSEIDRLLTRYVTIPTAEMLLPLLCTGGTPLNPNAACDVVDGMWSAIQLLNLASEVRFGAGIKQPSGMFMHRIKTRAYPAPTPDTVMVNKDDPIHICSVQVASALFSHLVPAIENPEDVLSTKTYCRPLIREMPMQAGMNEQPRQAIPSMDSPEIPTFLLADALHQLCDEQGLLDTSCVEDSADSNSLLNVASASRSWL
jgi:predicted transcriptional regulator